MAEPAAVTAWIPLVDVDETVGCMGYVAGSQNDPTTYVDIFRAPGSGEALMARYRERQPSFCPCQGGRRDLPCRHDGARRQTEQLGRHAARSHRHLLRRWMPARGDRRPPFAHA